MDVAPFGLGFISKYITSDTEGTKECVPCAKIFVEWFLADGKPAIMYVPLCKLTKPFYGQKHRNRVVRCWKVVEDAK